MTDETPGLPQQDYVILRAKGPWNPTDKHLVVKTREYVKVTLGEQDTYTYASKHDDYDSAGLERDRLNREQPQHHQEEILWAPTVLKLSMKTSPPSSPPSSPTDTPAAAAS